MSKVPLTKQGADRLQTELTELKTVKRPAVIQAIADAREHGDLKENAEYHAAREQQSFIEGRVKDIEGKLSNAQVIDIKSMPVTGKVIFGTTVELLDLVSEKSVVYQIVGEDEADIKAGKISFSSPVARALIGKEQGDEVLVRVPKGETEFEIVDVKYI